MLLVIDNEGVDIEEKSTRPVLHCDKAKDTHLRLIPK